MSSLVQVLEFPSSLLLAVSFLLIAFFLHRYAGGSKVVRVLRSALISRILLGVGAVLLAVEGTFSVPIHGSVVFAAYILIMMLSLNLVVLDALFRHAKVGFVLNHLGLLVIVLAAFFGAPDVIRCKMMLGEGETTGLAYTEKGQLIQLPFNICLDRFEVECYEDGDNAPKQFSSHLTVDGKRMTTAVNEPCSVDGYTIFQDGYDVSEGRYSILLLVRDPWLPIVYIGMAILAIGSVLLLFGRWNMKIMIPLTIILTVLFTVLSIYRINFQTLMPALRSWWFLPHLCFYMIAYSLMALGVVLVLLDAFKIRLPKAVGPDLPEHLMRSSSALLIIGMLTGSIWARQAWGDYWAWDSKENWAAVTWFTSLIYLHLSQRHSWKGLTILLLAFLALQVTWYGVNYLPSAINSLHTYTN